MSLHEASCTAAPDYGERAGKVQQVRQEEEQPRGQTAANVVACERKEVLALRASLTKFYAANSPHKMDKVDSIIGKYLDRGGGAEQVNKIDKSLLRTYGKGHVALYLAPANLPLPAAYRMPACLHA